MPEYLAPGVFVEEVSYRAKSIEGVSTTTTGFVGPTRYGPVRGEPELCTSLVEFERIYGGRSQLDFADGPSDNYMWHAVRAFFEEGGKRLYVSRVFGGDAAAARAVGANLYPPANMAIRARYPGNAGEARVTLQFFLSQNRYSVSGGRAMLSASRDRDVVYVSGVGAKADLYLLRRDVTKDLWTFENGTGGVGKTFELQEALAGTDVRIHTLTASMQVQAPDEGLPFFAAAGLALDPAHVSKGEPDSLFAYFAEKHASESKARLIPIVIGALDQAGAAAQRKVADDQVPVFQKAADDSAARVVEDDATALKAHEDFEEADKKAKAKPNDAALAQAAATAKAAGEEAAAKAAASQEAAAADAARLQGANALAANAKTVDDALAIGALDGLQVARAFLVANTANGAFTLAGLGAAALKPTGPVAETIYFLGAGSDGTAPGAIDYEGKMGEDDVPSGLVALEAMEDISIVAAPGSSADEAVGQPVANALIAHARRMQYRIAVIDSVRDHSIAEVRNYRAQFDSSRAAFYYPWVRTVDPLTGQENHFPPSGFVAGIYARNDVERGVFKAPANEVVNLSTGFERFITRPQQEVLNPEGINCFRFFEGRGMRLWGARTMSSDPEWKYVNLRRYFAFVERSIDKGTQWAVFEPNGERLWANVRATISDFLFNEWQNGALLGEKPEKAFFVKCDRSTMTQNDLDNGRLVCLVGLAPLRPAEFVIFRIGQWTADRKI
jgi:phage tail sheath protein FI